MVKCHRQSSGTHCECMTYMYTESAKETRPLLRCYTCRSWFFIRRFCGKTVPLLRIWHLTAFASYPVFCTCTHRANSKICSNIVHSFKVANRGRSLPRPETRVCSFNLPDSSTWTHGDSSRCSNPQRSATLRYVLVHVLQVTCYFVHDC